MTTRRSRTSSTLLLIFAAASLPACGGGIATGAGGSSSSSASTTTGTGGAGGTPQPRVILRDHAGHPAIGVDVLVHDASGATVQKTRTDKTGAASVDLVEGGGVTALWKTPRDVGVPEYTAVSVTGLLAGAEVRLVADVAPSSTLPAPTQLAFSGVAPLKNTDWDIVVSCHQESDVAEQLLPYAGCLNSASYDLVAFLAPGDKRLVFPAQAPQPGMNVPFSIDPARAEPAPPVTLAMTGVPAGTTRLEALLSANRPEGGKTRYLAGKDVFTTQDIDLSLARLFVSPGGSFDVDIAANTAGGGTHTRLYFQDDMLPTAGIPWHVPSVSAITQIDTLTGTVKRPEVPWTLDPASIPSDAVRIELRYSAFDPPPGGAQIHPVRWALYQASTTTGVARFPEIPDDFPGFTPENASLDGVAEHLDLPVKDSLLSAVNADFDRVAVSWSTTAFHSPPPSP